MHFLKKSAFFFAFFSSHWQLLAVCYSNFAPSNEKWDNSTKLLTTKTTKIMQLELNFTPAIDMQATMKDFCENLYSIIIAMQIITAPTK